MHTTVGDALRRYMTKHNIRTEEIAVAAGRSNNSIRGYLSGDVSMTADVLLRLFDKMPGFSEEFGYKRNAT